MSCEGGPRLPGEAGLGQKHRQGGNAKSVRNAESHALPRPAESDLPFKIPSLRDLSKVTPLGRGGFKKGPRSNSKARVLSIYVVLL